ncbi:hypothetical protein [Nostoc sphaeroides]|uniref:GTPase HflX n=1 Tax=Nostoc sphaeroides CCNUC1 TaxID=2653204 RepID=A0A5P8W515_9NOSO|nr:hypothetical protein [Nostoc sphaeroides]QFS47827.1 GTPase HflX [Nostoc sphaeroides CCNUC1]
MLALYKNLMAIFLSQEIVSDQNRVLLLGVETENISVQRFGYAVSMEG